MNDQVTPTEIAAVLHELRTIRKSQDHIYTTIAKLDGKIVGNGKPGIQDRLVTLETKTMMNEKSKGHLITMGTALMSGLIAIYALITKQ